MKLKKINLNQSIETEEGGYTHPAINSRKWYLAKIDNGWFAGQFSMEWFGLNFDGWHNHLQFDPPGINGSRWQELYEIVK